MKAKDNRKAALARIHIAKEQLGLDDAFYRQMLENLTGKRSCSDMVLAELYQVIRHLENVGFKQHRGRPVSAAAIAGTTARKPRARSST